MTNPTATTPSQKRRGRPVDPNGQLSKARAAFSSLPAGTSRQNAIAEFVKLGIKKDTAAAYYSVITRKAKSGS